MRLIKFRKSSFKNWIWKIPFVWSNVGKYEEKYNIILYVSFHISIDVRKFIGSLLSLYSKIYRDVIVYLSRSVNARL